MKRSFCAIYEISVNENKEEIEEKEIYDEELATEKETKNFF